MALKPGKAFGYSLLLFSDTFEEAIAAQALANVEQRISVLEREDAKRSESVKSLQSQVGTIQAVIATAPSKEKSLLQEMVDESRGDLRSMEDRLSTRLGQVEEGVHRLESSQVGFFDRLIHAILGGPRYFFHLFTGVLPLTTITLQKVALNMNDSKNHPCF